jgi:hypothetical protein
MSSIKLPAVDISGWSTAVPRPGSVEDRRELAALRSASRDSSRGASPTFNNLSFIASNVETNSTYTDTSDTDTDSDYLPPATSSSEHKTHKKNKTLKKSKKRPRRGLPPQHGNNNNNRDESSSLISSEKRKRDELESLYILSVFSVSATSVRLRCRNPAGDPGVYNSGSSLMILTGQGPNAKRWVPSRWTDEKRLYIRHVSNLQPDTEYWFRLGQGKQGPTINIRTLRYPEKPAQPTVWKKGSGTVTIINVTLDTITVKWKNPPDVTRWELAISDDKMRSWTRTGEEGPAFARPGWSSHEFSNLQPDHMYYIRVRVANVVTWSSSSRPVQVKTMKAAVPSAPPVAPAIVSVNSIWAAVGNWLPPTDDGGTPMIDCQLQVRKWRDPSYDIPVCKHVIRELIVKLEEEEAAEIERLRLLEEEESEDEIDEDDDNSEKEESDDEESEATTADNEE